MARGARVFRTLEIGCADKIHSIDFTQRNAEHHFCDTEENIRKAIDQFPVSHPGYAQTPTDDGVRFINATGPAVIFHIGRAQDANLPIAHRIILHNVLGSGHTYNEGVLKVVRKKISRNGRFVIIESETPSVIAQKDIEERIFPFGKSVPEYRLRQLLTECLRQQGEATPERSIEILKEKLQSMGFAHVRTGRMPDILPELRNLYPEHPLYKDEKIERHGGPERCGYFIVEMENKAPIRIAAGLGMTKNLRAARRLSTEARS